MNDMDILWQYNRAYCDYMRIESEIETSDLSVMYKKLYSDLTELAKKKKRLETEIDELEKTRAFYKAELVKLTDAWKEEKEGLCEMLEDEASADDIHVHEYGEKRVYSEFRDKLNALMKAYKETAKIGRLYELLTDIINKGKAIKTKYDDVKARLDELRTTKKSEIDAAKAELAKIEGQLQPELLRHFKNVSKIQKANPMVLVVNGTCGGCNTMLSRAALDGMQPGKIFECENCGRILYIPHEG